MNTSTEPLIIASRDASRRYRSVGYWLATVPVAAELGLGGAWDIARLPFVRDLVTHLGYPSIVSHLTTGYDLGEVGLLAVMTALTVVSWALRPASRRTHHVAAGAGTPRKEP